MEPLLTRWHSAFAMSDLAIRIVLLFLLAAIAQVHAGYDDLTKPLAVIAYSAQIVIIVGYAAYILWRMRKPKA